jgi:lipopolysaccharide export system permease protein
VFYAQTLETNGTFTHAWIQLNRPERTVILMAPKGRFEWRGDQLMLRLFNGRSYEGIGKRRLAQIEPSPVVVQKFATFEGALPKIQLPPSQPTKWALPTEALWASDQLNHKALLAWRWVVPMGLIVLGLLGLKLSKTGPREGRFAKVFIAIVLYVIYNQLLVTARDLISEGTLPWSWGLLPIPLIFLLYALYTPRRRKRPARTQAKGVAV